MMAAGRLAECGDPAWGNSIRRTRTGSGLRCLTLERLRRCLRRIGSHLDRRMQTQTDIEVVRTRNHPSPRMGWADEETTKWQPDNESQSHPHGWGGLTAGCASAVLSKIYDVDFANLCRLWPFGGSIQGGFAKLPVITDVPTHVPQSAAAVGLQFTARVHSYTDLESACLARRVPHHLKVDHLRDVEHGRH